ncbi:MAG: hypothetical protein U1E39_11275 [Planctomycetota bacterium]
MPPRSPALARIVERLAHLRARVRRIFATAGVGRLLAWTAGCLVAWFLADVFLDLPLGVRRFVRLGLLDRPADLSVAPWLGLLGVAGSLLAITARHGSSLAGACAFAVAGVPGVLCWVAARHLLSPLRIPLPDDALALSVEARFRGLEDRLAAALDFDREIAAPTRGESPAMMARVVDQAAAEADRLEFATVASARSARRALLAGLGGAAAAAVVFLAFASDAGLWARRALALEDVPWPRRTTIVAVAVDAAGAERVVDPGTPYVAALGQSLVGLARAQGRVPAEVEIVDRVASGGTDERPLAHRMRPVADREGLFEHEFRDVRSDFEFSLRGGDDDDGLPTYRVVVRVPPRVTALRADLVFPAYLGLPPRRVEGGTLQAPAGTKVSVAFSSDAVAGTTGGVARAEAFVGDVAAPVVREGDTFRFGFDAETSTRYRLRIVTTDGRENDPAADTYDVTVDPDTPPRPDWIFPRGGGLATTAKGRLPLFLDTRDDHGISSIRLEVLLGASETPTVVPLSARTAAAPDGANDRAYGATSILSYHPLELPDVLPPGSKLQLPTRVQVRAVATDAKGQEAAGPWVAVDVLQPDEVERGLATQRSRAKADVEAVREEVAKLDAMLGDLAAQGTLSEADRSVLRDVQFRVGKARGDLDRAGRAVTSIFTSYAYGRLGAEAPTATILALLDRRHRATFTRAAEDRGAAAPAGGEPADDADDVFPWAAFRELVAARRDRTLFDSGVLEKVITVVERVVEAAADRGPAALEVATRVARDGGAAELPALRAAVSAWRASLDATVTAMAEWQSLAELTLFVRRLLEEQERIDHDLKTLDTGGGRAGSAPGGR